VTSYPTTGANALGGADYQRNFVLLQRLANPYVAFDPVTNPYITVDYMDYVRTYDAVNRASNTTTAPNRSADATGGNSSGGYDPFTYRVSAGKGQPYAGYAAATGTPPVLPAYTAPLTSAVIKQNANPAPTNAPQNTFGRHNGRNATVPVGATYAPAPPATGNPTTLTGD